MNYGFDDRLAFSRGISEARDIDTIKSMLRPGCVRVEKTDGDMDRQGTDYLAYMRRGDVLQIDAKTRDKNAANYWTNGPEVALEIWSVMPGGRFDTPAASARAGWTLNEAKHVDLILYTFDPEAWHEAFLLSFPLLRAAFHRNFEEWTTRFRRFKQSSFMDGRRWESECIFVPIDVVQDGIARAQRAPLVMLQENAS